MVTEEADVYLFFGIYYAELLAGWQKICISPFIQLPGF